MVNLSAEEMRELRDFDAEEASRLEEQQKQTTRDHDYPKPELDDILEQKDFLEADFQAYRYGQTYTDTSGRDVPDPEGVPGLERIRAMRYHRDLMPEKWRAQLNTPYRFRSNLTANEIDRTVALATRNIPKVKIPPAGPSPEDRERAEVETRWANELLPYLERSVNEPLLRVFADALFEGGLALWEPYQTGAYDDIDFDDTDRLPDEDDDAFNERKDDELRRAGLPFGVRVPDNMTVLYDTDDEGVYVGMIVERKPYRLVYARQRRRLGPEKVEEMRMPRPGDTGWPEGAGWDTRFGSPKDTVETIRYYDRKWFVYVVAGKIVEVEEHGMPGVPLIPAWGTATSSSSIVERLHGVVWGMVEQEQALNDLITTEVDIGITFGRPKPVIETPPEGALRNADGKPTRLNLQSPGVPELMPGQTIKDAFAEFQSRIGPALLEVIMSIRQRSSLNPAAQGESPGADPSGFSINSLQAAAQMKYEILLDNYARSLGLLIDYIRRMVKETIQERVFLTAHTSDGGVEFLSIGPDEISDVPSEVSIDPMNDVNRLAIRESLMTGQQRGFVPRRVVQAQGFGAEEPERWDEEIAEDMADVQLMALALEEAKATVFEMQNPGGGPPDQGGQGPPGEEGSDLQSTGGAPAPPQGSTVGREVSGAQQGGGGGGGSSPASRNAARARGGQQPARQGSPVGANGASP